MNREKLKETIIQIADSYGYMETDEDYGWLNNTYKLGNILYTLTTDTEGVELNLDICNYRIDSDYDYVPFLQVIAVPTLEEGQKLTRKIGGNGFYMITQEDMEFKSIDELVDQLLERDKKAKEVIKFLYKKKNPRTISPLDEKLERELRDEIN